MADITIYKKTDEEIAFQYYETDGTTKRALTDATVYFTVKPDKFDSDADDSEATITKTVTSHTDAATGLTTITLTHDDTDVTPLNYFYDIKVKESDGKLYRAASGRCLVTGSPNNSAT